MSAAPRCAVWARDVGVRPLGTAVYATGWLLVEWPLPWPKDAKDVEALAPVREAIIGTGIRIQLVVPPRGADTRVVVLHDGGTDEDGWFRRHRRHQLDVLADDVVDATRSLLAEPSIGDPADVTDVLICGHGTRDRCCGSMGTALAIEAAAAGAKVWRTSHLGGHRFAPTAVLLPEGTSWGYLDAASLGDALLRTGSTADLAGNLRGSTAVEGTAAKAADGAALAEVGWAWLDAPRRVRRAGEDGTYVAESQEHGAWRVTVRERRRLPVPVCGEPPEDAPKAEIEVEVVSIEPVSQR